MDKYSIMKIGGHGQAYRQQKARLRGNNFLVFSDDDNDSGSDCNETQLSEQDVKISICIIFRGV